MYTIALALQAGRLTIHEIATDIPLDAGAIVAYLIISVFAFLIWFGSRTSTVERHRTLRTPVVESLENAGNEEKPHGVHEAA